MNTKSSIITERLNGPAEEAYRALRTNIKFCSVDREVKTIAVTSTYPNEGKTTTTLNLCISFAKTGLKVLFVDADLRKSMLSKDSILLDPSGLSNYLSGMADFENIIKKTDIDNLYITSCGPKPPNPAELIGSNRFKDFIAFAKENFDITIIDTPPLGSVIDGAIIASQTDGTVIVIEANTVEYKNVQKVKEQLEKANANIFGVVLNKLRKSEYKNYYNYYNYDGSTRRKKR